MTLLFVYMKNELLYAVRAQHFLFSLEWMILMLYCSLSLRHNFLCVSVVHIFWIHLTIYFVFIYILFAVFTFQVNRRDKYYKCDMFEREIVFMKELRKIIKTKFAWKIEIPRSFSFKYRSLLNGLDEHWFHFNWKMNDCKGPIRGIRAFLNHLNACNGWYRVHFTTFS